MRALAIALTMLAVPATAGARQAKQDAKPWTGYNQGIRWEASLDEALKRAAKEHKPVLLFQMVGDLDREGC